MQLFGYYRVLYIISCFIKPRYEGNSTLSFMVNPNRDRAQTDCIFCLISNNLKMVISTPLVLCVETMVPFQYHIRRLVSKSCKESTRQIAFKSFPTGIWEEIKTLLPSSIPNCKATWIFNTEARRFEILQDFTIRRLVRYWNRLPVVKGSIRK